MHDLSLSRTDSLAAACRFSCPETGGILVPQPGTELVACIARWILNYWATRAIPKIKS